MKIAVEEKCYTGEAMAIASFQNASVINSCFQWESQSPGSRQWDNLGGRRTRASSLVQLWQKLENKHLMSHSQPRVENDEWSEKEDGLEDGNEMGMQCQTRLQKENEDGNSRDKNQSADLGEVERERVRQIFHKWMKSADNKGVISARRNIQRLCGKQALLDLLTRARRERQRETQRLLERRPVSNFSHRNRIQSLLKARFLQIGRLIPENRPSPLTSSELDLLRERNTISSLREGFLSRLDNYIPGSAGNAWSLVSSKNNSINYKNEQTHSNSSSVDQDAHHKENDNMDSERNANEFCKFGLDMNTCHAIDCQEPTAQNGHDSQNDEEELQPSTSTVSIGWTESTTSCERNISDEISEYDSGIEAEECSHQLEAQEVFCERCAHELNESNRIGGRPWSHTSSGLDLDDWQGSSSNNEDNDWQWLDNVEVGVLRDETAESIYDWRESTIGHQCCESSGGDYDEYQYLQELQEGLHDNGRQRSPSHGVAPVGRFNSLYFPDDANSYKTDIRELLNRRSVTNRLQSDFREKLDQLMLSYVERQSRGSLNWELDGRGASPCPPTLAEQDVRLSVDHYNQDLTDAVDMTPDILPSSLEKECDTINDLRNGMDRLKHQIKNMHRMLDTCMDLQLELQHVVQQEVSAALNRFASSTEEGHDVLPMDESKWDHVKKGICCICCDSNIDSLLYRCGHMCTCSKCADKLVQARRKCPMCFASIVEMIQLDATQGTERLT